MNGEEKILSEIEDYILTHDIIVMAAINLSLHTWPIFCTRPNKGINFNYVFEWQGTARQYAYFIYKLSIEAKNHGQSIYKGNGVFDLHRFSLIFPTIKNYNNPQIDRKYLTDLKKGNEKPPKDYLFIDKAINKVFEN